MRKHSFNGRTLSSHALACLLTLLIVSSINNHSSLLSSSSSRISFTDEQLAGVIPNDNAVTLVPGDLPGYTGWVRPSYTSAPFYSVSYLTDKPIVNHVWKVMLTCIHINCLGQTPRFYVRAYGPSVLTGIIGEPASTQETNKQHYVITFVFQDPGVYWVEVVLEFSNTPSLDSYPNMDETAGYEGYLLPGTPIPIVVMGSNEETNKFATNNSPQQLCTLPELIVRDVNDGYTKSRWRVTKKVNSNKDTMQIYNPNENLTFHGYERNSNSLGIFMDLKPTTCELVKDATSPCLQDLHFIFIGDSVMNGKRRALLERIKGGANITMSCIGTYKKGGGGLGVILPGIKMALKRLKARTNPKTTYLFFNAGPHEIHGCSQMHRHEWKKGAFPETDKFSCSNLYKSRFTALVKMVDAFPAKLKIFSSTHVLWPRWGNWGFEWPLRDTEPRRKQLFSLSSHMINHFNTIAFDIISKESKSIQIVDEYWMTLARPDNREKIWGPANVLEHMSHPGFEIYDAMVRQWLTVVLATNRDSCEKLDDNKQ